MYSIGYILFNSSIFLAFEANFFPNSVCQRTVVYEMLSSFFHLFIVWARRRCMKAPFLKVVPSEDFILAKQLEEGGYFWPDGGSHTLFER